MRSKPILMIGLAVIVGGFTLIIANSLLGGASSPNTTVRADDQVPQFTTIVAAAKNLKFGDELNKSNLQEIPWPQEAVPQGAFSTISSLLAEGQRTVLYSLAMNEAVLDSKVTGPSERATLSRLITPGKRAVTIAVDDTAGVAGFALPGDRVDVVLMRTLPGKTRVADVILQSVKILGVDQLADDKSDEARVVKTVTVEVDAAGAQELALAQEAGSLSLVLRGSGDVAEQTNRQVNSANLGQSIVSYLRKDGDDTGAASMADGGDGDLAIIVVESDEGSQSYSVPKR